MELQIAITDNGTDSKLLKAEISTSRPFIEANTVEVSFEELRDNHIIPVFIKDNEPVISHTDFIEVTSEVVQEVYPLEAILKPNIRISHPIKGRHRVLKISQL